MQSQQLPIKYLTRWYSDETMGQTLALMLMEHADEISRWLERPERLLVLHSGLLDRLGDGFALDDISGEALEKIAGLRFAKLVLRKNFASQLDGTDDGWHIYAFYPIPLLPLLWTGDRNFLYLSRHIAGYFVSGIESEGEGAAAFVADLAIIQAQASAKLENLFEMLETLVQQLWPFEVAAAFWQEQLNRPFTMEQYAPDLLANWAIQVRGMILKAMSGEQ